MRAFSSADSTLEVGVWPGGKEGEDWLWVEAKAAVSKLGEELLYVGDVRVGGKTAGLLLCGRPCRCSVWSKEAGLKR